MARFGWTLSGLCVEQLALLCAQDVYDETKVIEYLTTPLQKFLFLLCLYAGTSKSWILLPGKSKAFNLLAGDWNLLVVLLKLQGDVRNHIHRIFQGLINTDRMPIHKVLVNHLIIPLESPNLNFPLKVVYEILLFTTFLQEAGWFAEAEIILSKLVNRMESVFIQDGQPGLTIEYFGPYIKDLPPSLRNKKNVYSAFMEIKMNLLKCIIHQPTAYNFKKAKSMILEMNLDEELLSNLKAEDQWALKTTYETLLSSYHYSQCQYEISLKFALKSMKNLLNYGTHRETLHAKYGESINSIIIQPKIVIDCLRQTSKVLMATGDQENSEKLMELAINMYKRELFDMKIRHDIYFAILLQDYGTLLQQKQRWKKKR